MKPHQSVVDRWQAWLEEHWPDAEPQTRTVLWAMWCSAVRHGRMLEREGVPEGPG